MVFITAKIASKFKLILIVFPLLGDGILRFINKFPRKSKPTGTVNNYLTLQLSDVININFSPEYPYIIQHTGNENTQTYHLDDLT